jgi:hypothetical protein
MYSMSALAILHQPRLAARSNFQLADCRGQWLLLSTSLREVRIQNDESPAVTDENGMEERCRNKPIDVHIGTVGEGNHRQIRDRVISKTEVWHSRVAVRAAIHLLKLPACTDSC